MELGDFIDERAKELEYSFSYDGYQIVRREMFAHLREPAMTIRGNSIAFNTACIAGLEDAVYIQVMIDPKEHRIAIRKCNEDDKDALRRCVAKKYANGTLDKRKSRIIKGELFSKKIYEMMSWVMDCRYKILGHRL